MHGLIAPYVFKNIGVYKCPADHGIVPGTQYPHSRSMSMNGFMGPANAQVLSDLAINTVKETVYSRDSDLALPGASQLWLLMDENPFSINDGCMVLNPLETQWIDVPASYHGGSGGIAYADGRALLRKWTDPSLLNDRKQEGGVGSNLPINGPDYASICSQSTYLH
jgi:prepilin-type processing-associated H-X9-DG protein